MGQAGSKDHEEAAAADTIEVSVGIKGFNKKPAPHVSDGQQHHHKPEGHVKEVAVHEDKKSALLECNELWSRKVQKGETLWHLSEKYLGDGSKWPYLQSACDLGQDPHRLQPGRPITSTCVTRAKEEVRVIDSFTC